MKEISVIVTTYMLDKYIRRAIDSVLEQTFKDYELIIIDDGSTDNTEEEIAKINDKRIKYIWQNHSGLPAKARNRGIEIAAGKLIAFLDGDDIWYPEKLHKCYKIFRKYPEIDLVCHNEVMRDISGKIIKELSYGPYVSAMFRRLLFRGNCLSPSATVVKKEALLDRRSLFREYPNFSTAEDYDLWLRLSKKYIFYFLPEVLGEFLLHDKNTSADFEKHYINQIEVIKKNFKEYEEKRTLDFCLINFRISRAYLVIAKNFARKKKLKNAFKYFLKAFIQFFACV